MVNSIVLPVLIIILFISCNTNIEDSSAKLISNREAQDTIIYKALTNAQKHPLYSVERQKELDKGLAEDSTIAYLWQQKAMPLFKQGKYEIGMDFIDKAVKYDRTQWQDYRAFIKCIFAKTYKDAIIDFRDCKVRYGKSYVMDHSYDFYIALSYLQLNEFQRAEVIFKNDIDSLINNKSEDWVHHLDLFYYGISKFEQKKYNEAIEIFNWALKKYPEFSDVQYYKAWCLLELGKNEQAKKLFKDSKQNAENGFSINEDNEVYERYPYQVRRR